jgi:multiple sugar transport system permease protein
MTRKQKKRLFLALRYALLLMMLIFILSPALWLFSTAFKGQQEILMGAPSFIPQEPTFDNFITAFTEQSIFRSARNSLFVSISAAVITVVLSVPAAYVLARFKGAASKVVLGWAILAQMVPFILIIIPLYLIVIRAGFYNNLLGLILVYTVWSLPYALWMLRNFIMAIPIELEESASIDGASKVQVIRSIIAPLLVPGLVVTTAFVFINSWNEFFFALVLIRDPEITPISLLIVRFIGANEGVRLGPLAAAALVATIPSVIAFAFLQKRLSGALIGGAVKG